ncbi:Phosphatidylinositol N-acetylglucosaminyltransferase subunit P [Cardamine amara subsp. amara]|uniref:Phosphatidylinositol N-acetylglucosaminyltransferase subunit P n=1 Tax=Cardamine amara subsp. amara TaxID=228776 RepID=A0ABD1BAX0_CARAN
MEEEAHLVNSQRRVLRKNQEAEVYGFVGSISIVVTTVIFLIWAYVPDEFLKFIEYFPNKYWAMAMPTYLMMTVLSALVFYIGLNFMATSTPTSLHTLFDEYSREAESFVLLMNKEEDMPIDPISDIDITRINDIMFGSSHGKR